MQWGAFAAKRGRGLMQRSAGQKILLVFSIIEIVLAALAIILALFALAGGAVLGGASGVNDIVVNGVPCRR